MNINDLRIFEAVALHENFTKAADTANTVQSNVTARIKSMEDEFGTPLFDRTSRKVVLTSAGKKLMVYSKQINQLYEEARREVPKAKGINGRLKIGCIETTMALKVPALLNEFMQKYPDITLEFKSELGPDLVNDVLNYKLDAAFVPGPISLPELNQLKVSDDKLVLVSSTKYTTQKNLLSNQDVTIVVFDQGCSYRARLESWLSAKGIVTYKSIVLNTLEGIINFVEAGLGFTVLPKGLIDQYYSKRKLNLIPLAPELASLTTVLVYRKDIPQSGALKVFLGMY
ncbi:MAG TPA: LysR family transcriptional regulator [Ohtaekwangia sp.]|uniref:LysR family transcriptional regulator n=1 Tax=Ohtaekwangia sp. TaxID=2066019 RepID=UPI002F938325